MERRDETHSRTRSASNSSSLFGLCSASIAISSPAVTEMKSAINRGAMRDAKPLRLDQKEIYAGSPRIRESEASLPTRTWKVRCARRTTSVGLIRK
jgi:hypothetical protein